MLQELNLSQAFEPIVIAEELLRGKPDPLPYQTALDRLNITALEAIAFEDSAAGIRSAVSAGIPTIGMTTTHLPADLLALGADKAIADFTDPYIQALI